MCMNGPLLACSFVRAFKLTVVDGNGGECEWHANPPSQRDGYRKRIEAAEWVSARASERASAWRRIIHAYYFTFKCDKPCVHRNKIVSSLVADSTKIFSAWNWIIHVICQFGEVLVTTSMLRFNIKTVKFNFLLDFISRIRCCSFSFPCMLCYYFDSF